jgi:DNA-directed RNA polymerase sigma subunit (sigma70/sigma32)
MESLDDRSQYILRHRFGLQTETETLSALGEHFGLSRERVRQLQNRALDQLRCALEEGSDRAAA